MAEARPYRVRLGISMFVRCPDDLTHCCITQVVSLGDVLGASAARGTVRHEAVVIEVVAPRHIRSVLAGQRSEGTIRAQLAKPVLCAKAVERGCGFRCAGNGKRAAASHRRREQRARDVEKPHRHPVLPNMSGERKRLRSRASRSGFNTPLTRIVRPGNSGSDHSH